MKRMIDNKDYETLKDNVNNINEELELKDTNYIISNVVVEDNKVLGSQIKDVENDVTYNLPLGSQVEANPTLEGTESNLEGIEIDGTKYKVGGGGSQKYQHNILMTSFVVNTQHAFFLGILLTNDNPNPMSYYDIANFVGSEGFNAYTKAKICVNGGAKIFNDTNTKLIGLYKTNTGKLGLSYLNTSLSIGGIVVTTPEDAGSDYDLVDTVVAL